MDGTDKIADKLLEICGVIDGYDGVREMVKIVRRSLNKLVKMDVRITCWRANLTLVIVFFAILIKTVRG